MNFKLAGLISFENKSYTLEYAMNILYFHIIHDEHQQLKNNL